MEVEAMSQSFNAIYPELSEWISARKTNEVNRRLLLQALAVSLVGARLERVRNPAIPENHGSDSLIPSRRDSVYRRYKRWSRISMEDRRRLWWSSGRGKLPTATEISVAPVVLHQSGRASSRCSMESTSRAGTLISNVL